MLAPEARVPVGLVPVAAPAVRVPVSVRVPVVGPAVGRVPVVGPVVGRVPVVGPVVGRVRVVGPVDGPVGSVVHLAVRSAGVAVPISTSCSRRFRVRTSRRARPFPRAPWWSSAVHRPRSSVPR